ncbi:hypothetical protein DMJ13_22865 [halophilic archaeon]|nr:hypothetical protein DMJ13_22865 [halophilic archaeon]
MHEILCISFSRGRCICYTDIEVCKFLRAIPILLHDLVPAMCGFILLSIIEGTLVCERRWFGWKVFQCKILL